MNTYPWGGKIRNSLFGVLSKPGFDPTLTLSMTTARVTFPMSNQIRYRISSSGCQEWFDEDGLHHREDGPAILYPDETAGWYVHGNLHRDGGPAVIVAPNLNEPTHERLIFYQHNRICRYDGPALIYQDGHQIWMIEDNLVEERDVGIIKEMLDDIRKVPLYIADDSEHVRKVAEKILKNKLIKNY